MAKYKITGIKTATNVIGSPRFDGFLLHGVIGAVNPLISGDLEKLYFETDALEIKWAEAQVGKTLECDEIFYQAFAVSDDVTITDGKGEPCDARR